MLPGLKDIAEIKSMPYRWRADNDRISFSDQNITVYAAEHTGIMENNLMSQVHEIAPMTHPDRAKS